jgi:hypothetical protein
LKIVDDAFDSLDRDVVSRVSDDRLVSDQGDG